MIIPKLKSLSFIMALLLIMSILGISAVPKALAVEEETVPGYRILNVYDAENGVVTSKIYVTNGKALVGMLGLAYNTELVSLAATVNNTLTTEYDDLAESGKIGAFISKGSGITVLDGTNRLTDLINKEAGEFFFEWYHGFGGGYLDATKTDAGLAVIKFKVNDGVTKEELENCGIELITFASEKPSDSNVKGYGSGAYITNEENTGIRNNGKSRYSLTLYTEYEGLDIAGGFEIKAKDAESGIIIPETHGTSKRIMIVPRGTTPADIQAAFAFPTGMTSEIFFKDGTTDAETVKTGDYARLTKENYTETILIAVKSDTDGDGNVTMADLNTMMRIISGSIEAPAEEAIYAVDTNGDGLTKAEYDSFVEDIIDNNK